MDDIKITVLVENTVYAANLKAEHGLSLWIEYGDKNILFDTGQTELVVDNAPALNIDLSKTDAIVLSHSHYDHTGGLEKALNIAEDANVYFHPEVLGNKYQLKEGSVREIGTPAATRELLRKCLRAGKAIYTKETTEILSGLSVTGKIPRKNDFEDTGGGFFLDERCTKPDPLNDDQSLFMQSTKGIIVILGCAHSGVVNTLDYIQELTEGEKIHAVIGGMHLVNADENRIEKTVEALRKYNIGKLYPCHCTGTEAKRILWKNFSDKFMDCSVNNIIEI